MSAVTGSTVRRGGASSPADSVGIYSIPEQFDIPSVSLLQLEPAEARLSMPPERSDSDAGPIGALTRFIGDALTVANPAWSGDPVHTMRGLQKRLLEHSLTLDETQRSPCLAAIAVVEDAVQWRLRLQQMRMNEVEREIELQARKVKAA